MTNITVKFNAQINANIEAATGQVKEAVSYAAQINQAPWLEQNQGKLALFIDAEDELINVAEDADIEDIEEALSDFEPYMLDHLEAELNDWNCYTTKTRVGVDTFVELEHNAFKGLAEAADAESVDELYSLAESHMVSEILVDDLVRLDALTAESVPTASERNRFLGEMTENLDKLSQVVKWSEALLDAANQFNSIMWNMRDAHTDLDRASDEYTDLMVHSIDSLFIEWAEEEGI